MNFTHPWMKEHGGFSYVCDLCEFETSISEYLREVDKKNSSVTYVTDEEGDCGGLPIHKGNKVGNLFSFLKTYKVDKTLL